MKQFNEDQLINLIQSVGKIGGGALAAYGAQAQQTWTAVIGAALALVAFWCSHHSNAAAAPPAPTAIGLIPPPERKDAAPAAMAVAKVLAFGLLALGLASGCAKLAPGADPLVVRTEQMEQQAYNTFDLFLKLDDTAMSNTNVGPAWAVTAHPFATYLRKPIANGTNVVPFGIATVLSLDQVKLSYQGGIATSNALAAAMETLSATVAQASQYTSLLSTNK